MYADDAYIQPQAVGRERCVDLVPRAVVQVEHAIDRRKCQLRRRQFGLGDVRVAHPPVEHHFRDRQRCEVQSPSGGPSVPERPIRA